MKVSVFSLSNDGSKERPNSEKNEFRYCTNL